MDKNSTKYTVGFALVICVICSFLLALISEGLRERRELNEELDYKENILKAVGFEASMLNELPLSKTEELYQKKIDERYVNVDGKLINGNEDNQETSGQKGYSLYIYHEEGTVEAYVFPVYGKGLWSTIYGFLALEEDVTTIRGITFYKHGETPGLGGEVEAKWFQDNFKGKKIYDVKANELRPVRIVKGKVSDKLSGRDMDFAVDGISGATMTSKGVTEFLDKWINVYEPYFEKIRTRSP